MYILHISQLYAQRPIACDDGVLDRYIFSICILFSYIFLKIKPLTVKILKEFEKSFTF